MEKKYSKVACKAVIKGGTSPLRIYEQYKMKAFHVKILIKVINCQNWSKTHFHLKGSKQFSIKQFSHVFQVDSLEFVGQKHKWLVTQLLIKGQSKTHETLLNNLASSIYLIGM